MRTLWSILTYPLRTQPRGLLAARRPGRDEMGQNRLSPLGMEATDLSLIDRVARQNDALERAPSIVIDRKGTFAARASTHVDAMPEDETYAARYHRAFMKKDT
ncbi:MAG: hypothetical protein HOI22_03560 [Tateyamaria sp.]|jgi:hypothetical protein|nr:hypothetical protein [Tateyamaria sp.]